LHRFDGTTVEVDEVYAPSPGGSFCGTEEWQALYETRTEKVVLA
jgi:hypothetical protein